MEESQGLELSEEAFGDSISSWKHTCCLAANSARYSYQRALLLAPWEANIYMDIAISSDLINSLTICSSTKSNAWYSSFIIQMYNIYSRYSQRLTILFSTRQPVEKMAIGALLLETENYEFWVALGSLSNHSALKQHALIRALQLDVSLAVAWACLGKVLSYGFL